MSNLEFIKQIEKQTGTQLKECKVNFMIEGSTNGYALNIQKQLIGLNLDKCNLNDISFLSKFTQLRQLSLQGNKISNLAPLKNLTGLTTLNLAFNEITEFAALKGLKKLSHLDLTHNKITELSEWILDFKLDVRWDYLHHGGVYLIGNLLESPPPEIIKQGNTAIKAYFDSLTGHKRPLNQLKVLFVGDGGAGKTSLSKVLRNQNFDLYESQTHGINIHHWHHQDLTLHFWDFGGQETMHATHQFFLSERSLYILVLDGRKEEDAEYWLKHIESFGGSSPILVVLNKLDENPSFDVNRKHLSDKYSGIVGFYKLSCNTKVGLENFKLEFINGFEKIEMPKTVWGENWFKVKTELETLGQHYITCEQYRNLCLKHTINEAKTQDILAQYLNDLGVVVHFPDLELNDTHVLEPRWITEAVYKVINSKQLAKTQGLLCLKDLADILKPSKKEDFDYPSEKHCHIIKLMEKFELCYQFDKDHILIPNLLDIQEPQFEFADNQPLRFQLKYDFLPKSIMPRFIVKRHQEIQDTLRWRTGVVLYDKNNGATAIIRADDRERLIDIKVGGIQKRDYFAVIRGTLNEIRASFEKIDITELVPLPDNPEICVEYQELIGYEQAGKDDFFVGKLGKLYSVSNLLNGLEKPEQRPYGNIYVNRDYVQKVGNTEIIFEGHVKQINGDITAAGQITKINESSKPKKPENDDKVSKLLKVITENRWFIFAVLVFIVLALLLVGYFVVEKGLITNKTVETMLNKSDDKAR